MGLARFRVDCTDPVRPVVSVNDEIVPPLKRCSFDWSPAEIPHLYLELMGEGVLEGEGVVVQRIPTDLNDVALDDLLIEILNKIDPSTLERDMAEACGGFGGGTTGEAALAVLKRYIKPGG